MSRRKVTYAKVHQDLFIPGIGSLGTTLPPNGKTLAGLSMSLIPEGLELTTQNRTAVVPLANIVIMVVENVEVANNSDDQKVYRLAK